MSPVMPEYFMMFKSMHNAQVISQSNGTSKYICKYVTSDDPTRIHTLRKYVGQADDKTNVETVRAKQ